MPFCLKISIYYISERWGFINNKIDCCGTSRVVQWLRLCASNTGDAGSIPGQGTKIPNAAWPKKKEKKKNPKMNAVISERLGVPIEFLGDKLKFKKIPDT